MAYQTDEQSVQSGKPREVYRFTGTYNTYRLTSFETPLVVGGETYSPVTITRNALKVGTQEQGELSLEVSLPFTHPMIREYAYDQAPPTLMCEIFRVHATDLNDAVLLWKGRATSFTVEGRLAKINIPSIFGYILAGSAPTPRYQGPCNHLLYDARCGVSEAANRHSTTVSAIVNNIITVASNPYVTDDVASGMMRIVSSGESRMITQVIGLDIYLTYPFSSIEIGTPVEILRGCAHDFNTCKVKFGNGSRFGGTPLVPQRNPFTGKI